MPSAKKTVLIIEDSELTRTRYKEALEHEGYKVIESSNGSDGFSQAIMVKPDLIILDLIMPRMGGLGVLDMLQGDLGVSHIPVVVITGNDREDEREQAISSGAKMYILKGSSVVKELVSAVERLIGTA